MRVDEQPPSIASDHQGPAPALSKPRTKRGRVMEHAGWLLPVVMAGLIAAAVAAEYFLISGRAQ